MPLTMRPTGLSSGIDKDRKDWTIFDDGKAPTLAVAKAKFETAWQTLAGVGAGE